MEYIQKVVPPNSPMLQVPHKYDVISFRIEYVKTAKNPTHSPHFENEYLRSVPQKYLEKYIDGLKVAPFLRVYRTIAPHNAVMEALNRGGSRDSLFKNSRQIKETEEEICYTSFAEEFVYEEEVEIDFSKLLDDDEPEPKRSDFYSDEKREYRKVIVPKLKHKSNKFIRKCLAIDDFFDDVTKYLMDPKSFHRKEIIERAVKLDYVFDECDGLDERLPEGFANKTSGWTKEKIAEILSVIEILKWQIGMITNIDDEVFSEPFNLERIMENSREYSMFEREIAPVFELEESYVEKEIMRNCKLASLVDDKKYYLQEIFKLNPHKVERYAACAKPDYCNRFAASIGLVDMLAYAKDIKKTIWTGKETEATCFAEEMLKNIQTYKLNFKEEKDIHILRQKIKIFNEQFVEGFLMKNVDKYPKYIAEKIRSFEEYPGIFIHMFDKERIMPLEEFPIEKIVIYEMGEIMEDEKPYQSIFDSFSGYSGAVPAPLLFDLNFLLDYSNMLVVSGEAERKGLTVGETLQRIQRIDREDNIAGRLLAALVSERINKSVILDMWNRLTSKKTFKDTEEKSNPSEARAIEAFKIYRRTLKTLTECINRAVEEEPIIQFDKNPEKLPSLYEEIEKYLLDRMLEYSRVPLNKVFGRDAVTQDPPIDILSYISRLNNDARIIRNKIAHGMDINESEFEEFMLFCNKIERVADETMKIIKMLEKNDEKDKS